MSDIDDDLKFGSSFNQKESTTDIKSVDRTLSVTDQLHKALEEKRLLEEQIRQQKIEQAKNQNKDFVQLTRAEMRKISELSSKKGGQSALNLLMLFAQNMNKQNAVMISFDMLEKVTGKSRATIDRSIKLLKQDQWIQVVKVGNANVYVLNSAVFWTDKADKRFASFSAQIVTTLDEQDADIRKNPEVKLRTVPAFFQEPELMANGLILGDDELPPPDQLDTDLR